MKKTLIHLLSVILNIYSPEYIGVHPSLFFTLTSAPFEHKYTTMFLCPAEEAVNEKTLIHLPSVKLNIYLPQCSGVLPSLSFTLTSAPFENKYSTISL
jgi:hypothetical protein